MESISDYIFKVGDRVRIAREGDADTLNFSPFKVGHEFNIAEFCGDYAREKVNHTTGVHKDLLDLVSTPKFKIGDRVQTIHGVGTIQEVDSRDNTSPYRIMYDKLGYDQWGGSNSAVLIDKLEFKAGDRVEIVTFDCSGCKVGDITTLTDDSGTLYAKRTVESSGCSHQKNWKLVEKKKEDPNNWFLSEKYPIFVTSEQGLSQTWAYEMLNTAFTTNYTNKPTKIKKLMSSISLIAKKLLDPSFKTLIAAGYMESDLTLTGRGRDVMEALVFEANKEALVVAAQADLDESNKK